LRLFKRKIEANGLIQELRDRMEYVKPTTKRKIAKGRAKSRWRKYIASQGMPKKLY
jgi:small subunit ribosomal protein S21